MLVYPRGILKVDASQGPDYQYFWSGPHESLRYSREDLNHFLLLEST